MKDRLHEIFQMMLVQTDNMAETDAQLISRVAGVYALELQQNADIPGEFLEDVLCDLEAEVLIMYRKTTYGSWSLREFREKRVLGQTQEG